MKRQIRGLVVAASCGIPSSLALADPSYELVPLEVAGGPGTSFYGWARAINNAGVIGGGGSLYVNGEFKDSLAVRWDAGSKVGVPLGHLGLGPDGKGGSSVTGVDAAGTVYGTSTKYDGGQSKGGRAVRWAPGNTQPFEMGILGTGGTGMGNAAVNGVSASGLAVGTSTAWVGVSLVTKPVYWSPGNDTPEPLRTFPWGGIYAPADANSAGSVVGLYVSMPHERPVEPIRWDGPGSAPTILEYGAGEPGSAGGDATAINEAGLVVGTRRIGQWNQFRSTPTYWEPGSTTPKPLPDPFGLGANPRDVNNAGAIVGSFLAPPGGPSNPDRAALWVVGSEAVVNLNEYAPEGWTLLTASAINDKGQIVGQGIFDPDGNGPVVAEARPYLLNPKWDADANGDLVVDFADFQVLERNFGRLLANVDAARPAALGDFNADGRVDEHDFSALREEFGRVPWEPQRPATLELPALSVPEPGVGVLCAAGGMLLLRRRVRQPRP